MPSNPATVVGLPLCRLPPAPPGANLHAYPRRPPSAPVLMPRIPPVAWGQGPLIEGGLRTGATPADRITDLETPWDL